MILTINAPSTLKRRSLTQNVKIKVNIDPLTVFCDDDTMPIIINVTNGEVQMCKWEIAKQFNQTSDWHELIITSELLDVVNDTEVKVILNGVVLDFQGSESVVRGSSEGLIKKGGKLKMVLGSRVSLKRNHNVKRNPWTINIDGVNIGSRPQALLDLAIEYLDQNIPLSAEN